MLDMLNHPLAIPIYGAALFLFFLWRIFASIPSRDPKYSERICRILNMSQTKRPTQLISTFLTRIGIPGTKFTFMPRAGEAPGYMLIVWIREKEYAFVEGDGKWEIYYQD